MPNWHTDHDLFSKQLYNTYMSIDELFSICFFFPSSKLFIYRLLDIPFAILRLPVRLHLNRFS